MDFIKVLYLCVSETIVLENIEMLYSSLFFCTLGNAHEEGTQLIALASFDGQKHLYKCFCSGLALRVSVLKSLDLGLQYALYQFLVDVHFVVKQ
jgi:hypothetical protein